MIEHVINVRAINMNMDASNTQDLRIKRCTACKIDFPISEFYKGRADCKRCVRARSTTWRAANRERHRAQSRAWELAHPAHVKLRKKIWVQTNRDKHNETNRNWALNNPDKVAANGKRWYRANREYALARDAAWAKANRDKKRIHEFTRRARETNAAGATTPEQLQARIDYYGGLCYVCRDPFAAIDHVISLKANGTNWPANLRPICRPCNSSKGAKSLAEFLETRAQARI